METFLLLILAVVVAAFLYFAVRHKEEFIELFLRDAAKVKDEAKVAKGKVRAELREVDDKVREAVTEKFKKIRSRVKK